jgi:hypothetical protein
VYWEFAFAPNFIGVAVGEPSRLSRRPGYVVSTILSVSAIVSGREGIWASNSAGGRSPRAWCRRLVLNQPRYSTTASSSWERVCQSRSEMSSA